MNQIELKNKVINWLFEKNSIIKRRPHYFTPKEITDEVGGYPGTLGRAANEIVDELILRGVKIDYIRAGNVRKFALL